MSELSLGKVRGNMWYDGDGITGSSTSPTIFSGSGVTKAYVGDHYLNTDTDRGNVYACVTKGDPTEAEWVYVGTILGPMPDVVNNLESTSTTKALSAAMGKKLNDLLDSCGIQPYVVNPTSDGTSFTASVVIDDKDTTFTVVDDEDNEGTYSYTNGGGTTATVNITIGTSIGLPNNGAVIKSIKSSGAKIISYALYDSASTEIFSETPSIWEHLTNDELNIMPYSDITEGLNTYKSGLISKIISEIRTTLYPITHAKAVWFDKSANQTVHDKIGSVDTKIGAMDDNIAPTEVSPSENAYSIGDTLIYNDVRYKVTAAISIGDSLTDGTNIEEKTVDDDLVQINSDLSELNSKTTSNTVNYTLENGCTVQDGKIYRQGDIVFIQLRLTTPSAFNDGTTLVSGLPALAGYGTAKNAAQLNQNIMLVSNGSINVSTSGGAILPASTYILLATYVAKQ